MRWEFVGHAEKTSQNKPTNNGHMIDPLRRMSNHQQHQQRICRINPQRRRHRLLHRRLLLCLPAWQQLPMSNGVWTPWPLPCTKSNSTSRSECSSGRFVCRKQTCQAIAHAKSPKIHSSPSPRLRRIHVLPVDLKQQEEDGTTAPSIAIRTSMEPSAPKHLHQQQQLPSTPSSKTLLCSRLLVVARSCCCPRGGNVRNQRPSHDQKPASFKPPQPHPQHCGITYHPSSPAIIVLLWTRDCCTIQHHNATSTITPDVLSQ